MKIKNPDALIPAAIFILSFTVRFLFLDEAASSPVYLLNTLRGTDMEGYLRWAVRVSAGTYDSATSFWQAPGYPYFAAGIFDLFGVNIYVISFLQVILSSLTSILIYFIAGTAFNKKTGAAAGLISSFYAPFIFYAPFLLSETLGVFLIAASLFYILKSTSNPALKFIIPGGVLLGLASLVRPNFLLFAVFFIFYQMIKIKNLKQFLEYVLFFSASLAAVIAPVTVRNYFVSGEFVLISANFAETFRLSNSLDSLVLNYTEPRLGMMAYSSSEFWVHQLKKALYFWWGFEVPQNINYYLTAKHSTVLNFPLLPFWLIGPMGLTGIWLWARSNYRREKTLIIFVLSYYASIVMLYIVSRFRVPFMAGLIPFSAFTATEIVRCIHNKKMKAASTIIIFCAALSFLSYPRGVQRIRATDYRMLGVAMAQEGMYIQAIEPLEKSLQFLPPGERKQTRELLFQLREIAGAGNADGEDSPGE